MTTEDTILCEEAGGRQSDRSLASDHPLLNSAVEVGTFAAEPGLLNCSPYNSLKDGPVSVYTTSQAPHHYNAGLFSQRT